MLCRRVGKTHITSTSLSQSRKDTNYFQFLGKTHITWHRLRKTLFPLLITGHCFDLQDVYLTLIHIHTQLGRHILLPLQATFQGVYTHTHTHTHIIMQPTRMLIKPISTHIHVHVHIHCTIQLTWSLYNYFHFPVTQHTSVHLARRVHTSVWKVLEDLLVSLLFRQ